MQDFSEHRPAVRFRRLGKALILVAGLAVLAACDTAEERAEKHYQTGLALIEEGDFERGLVELRNVFKLNGQHQGARLTYARVQRDRGFNQQAYSQYLRLVEQYPNNLEGRQALAEMALVSRDWEEVERHAAKAIELAPDSLPVQSIDNTMKYFYAVRDKDEDARSAAVVLAQSLIENDSSLASAREIVIDDLVRKQDWYAALEAIDDGLAQMPEDKSLYRLRLGVLQQIGDSEAIVAQLRELIALFPEDRSDYKRGLIQYYISQNQIDQAEDFLREQADLPDASSDDRGFFLGFLERFRSPDAAMAEAERFIALNDKDIAMFRSIRAKLNFDAGKADEAIAEMEALVQGAEPTDEIRAIEVNLARMLFAENNSVGARALVEKVLSEDRSQPDAIKLKANWLIDDDETGDAIVMLRDALGLTPQDADLMTLMAKAHEREGNRDLMIEMLTLAVQASNNAPAESLRYVNVLMTDDKLRTAESVIIDALRVRPRDMALLFKLGEVYVRMKDWSRTEGVIEALNGMNEENATNRATELRARILLGQERGAELTALLENLAENPDMKGNVNIALVRTRVANEGAEAGLLYVEELLEDQPTDPQLRFVKAGLKANLGAPQDAEVIFRDLVNEDPTRSTVWMAFYRLLASQGKAEESVALLDEALVAVPENSNLLWAKAGVHERAGEPEDAIAIYEMLYERSSSSLIIANNLASLLAVHRDDAESLQRAHTVARRLRESDIPAFQDTYGWISHRRGNYEEAVGYLESAANALPNEPSVQFHYASTLAQLGRRSEALERFEMAQELLKNVTPAPVYADRIANEIEQLTSGVSQD
ncbi:MAG: tetratricopeptide repeat protein [Sedimentitalea sp.]